MASLALAEHVAACERCRAAFLGNVALLVADDDAALKPEQEAAALVLLRDLHAREHRVTFRTLSVLVPTRGRPGYLRALLESYDRTASGAASELVFRADDDDPETVALLASTAHRVVVGPRERGYESLPQFFNELASAARGDVLMLGNDDVVFVTTGWAEQILEAANRYPDGVFNIGVRTHNEAHFPLSVVSRAVVDRLGFLYDPRIFWGDIFLRDVMGRLGRRVVLPDVEIRHEWAGFAPDRTFIEGEGARRRGGNWMEHHAQAVDEAEEKLRGLLA